VLKKWFGKLSKGNTLYYPGCVTRYALPDVQERYERLLRQAKVDFIVLPGELQCCGSPVRRAGYHQDFDRLKAKNIETFARFSVTKIITNCPGCYHTLKYEYQMDVVHTTQVLSEKNAGNPSKSDLNQIQPLTYHDPCHLGRWSGIYDEPRHLLHQAGWQIVELPDNREMSLCCGAGGGVKSNYPDLANSIAQARLAQVENGRLCTSCPLCYAHFKENAGDIQVMEFSEALTQVSEARR
jgi:Fe-S oxidoreductase